MVMTSHKICRKLDIWYAMVIKPLPHQKRFLVYVDTGEVTVVCSALATGRLDSYESLLRMVAHYSNPYLHWWRCSNNNIRAASVSKVIFGVCGHGRGDRCLLRSCHGLTWELWVAFKNGRPLLIYIFFKSIFFFFLTFFPVSLTHRLLKIDCFNSVA